MSLKQKFEVGFNTALTKINEEDGKFDEDEFLKQVLPIRGKIMQIDGVCGCSIGRYGFDVVCVENATDMEVLKKSLEEIFEKECVNEGFYPLKGDKEPKLIWPKNLKWVK
ncbi:MAG: hypothetical protein MRY49_02780 [Candidatus Pacebacteria bacterium]|nr:hypothetical protein [Candidatus Paceibacterota bacterium]